MLNAGRRWETSTAFNKKKKTEIALVVATLDLTIQWNPLDKS
jgi:hypothetical protein